MRPTFLQCLWFLKLGALANLAFVVATPSPWTAGIDPRVAAPALILFAVSAYRCLFPVRYEHNTVLHDHPLSSIFATRLLATFSEVAYIFLFSHVLRVVDGGASIVVAALSWLMVAEAVVSQGFVWGAILTGRLRLYVYEEAGWFVLFAANTLASAWILATHHLAADHRLLMLLNLAFGALYLPWQVLHLRSLAANAARDRSPPTSFALGLRRALREKNRRTDAAAWGSAIGLTWMVAYWATLIPAWVFLIARTMAAPSM